MIMKKIVLCLAIMFALVTTSVDAYAVEVSLGVSGQPIGINILRGSGAESFTNGIKAEGFKSVLDFLIEGRIDLMVEFSPYLALETGIGQKISFIYYEGMTPPILGISVVARTILQRLEFTVPIMIRGQYEFERQLVYASVGVRLGIPLTNSYVLATVPSLGQEKNVLDSKFSMDVAFALGLEGRLGDANYLGVRVSYDLNVIEPFDTKDLDEEDFFHDSFGIALTYRYAFNSKWKKGS